MYLARRTHLLICRALRTVAVVAAVALASSATAQSQVAFDFDLPAQPLELSLRQIADTQKLQLAYTRPDLNGITASAVKGRYTAAEAVSKAMEGTGLVATFTRSDTVVIKPKSANEKGGQAANPTLLAQAQSAERQGGRTEDGAQMRKGDVVRGEGIVVTAQKREERALDVPQSVSVLSADELFKQGIVQFRDYADRVPGLSFYTLGSGYSQVSLRGVTIGQDISPTVGIYLDDVPYGSSTAFAGGAWTALDVGLSNLERIEVLRGPQGTLYGSSTMGGLIKYVTRRPDPMTFSGRAQAGVSRSRDGGWSHDVSASLNLPIVPGKAAATISAFTSRDGGYVDNPTLDRANVNSADVEGGRVDFLYAPTPDLSVRLTGYVQDTNREGMTQVDYTFAGQPLYGELVQRRVTPEPFENRFRLVSGTVNYDFGPATLTSISSFQTTEPRIVADGSVIYVPLLRSRFERSYGSVAVDARYTTDKFAQEVRLASRASQDLEWLVGGFHTREESEAATVLAATDPTGQPRPRDEVSSTRLPSRYEESSAFGNLTWHLTEELDVTGGLRFARYKQEFSQSGVGLLGASTPFRQAEDNVVTYLANSRYRFTDWAMAYVRYATGYRPGGVNFVRIDLNTGRPVAPEAYGSDKLSSYEVGYKHDSPDGRFGMEVAGYWIDWKDIQLVGRRNGVALRTNSLGGATVKGVEFALSARPVRTLTLSAALNYQRASLNQDDPDLPARRGERLPNSPDFTASLSADYTFAQSPLMPSVGASYRHVTERTSGYELGTGSKAPYRLPSYSMVDLRAGLKLNAVELQFYVRNVFDERAQLSAYTVYGSPLVTVAQPRTIGVTATTRF